MTDKSEGQLEKRSTSIKFPITPRTLPKLIRLGWALHKAERGQDLEAEHPSLVMFDEHSSALIELARELAADAREDRAAVSELADRAKGHKRALRVAALGTRQHGSHMESSLENLAHRLLQAAIADTEVEPLSRDEEERLEQIDAFAGLPRGESWRVLTEREPRLAELEVDAHAGRFGGREVMALPEEERQQAAGEELQGMRRLDERLKPLVGPKADTSDVILATHTALEVARAHLPRLRRQQQSESET
ncbi:MAG: hypothetical protein ACRDK2_15665 [Solirubrobacteraceae bacterium]